MSKLEQTLAGTARMLCVERVTDPWKSVWSFHGVRHRDFDKPAVVWANGDKEWFNHSFRHRDYNKPAVVYSEKCIDAINIGLKE